MGISSASSEPKLVLSLESLVLESVLENELEVEVEVKDALEVSTALD
jgi:hypothetical protein